jgi:hypothetical protein
MQSHVRMIELITDIMTYHINKTQNSFYSYVLASQPLSQNGTSICIIVLKR